MAKPTIASLRAEYDALEAGRISRDIIIKDLKDQNQLHIKASLTSIKQLAEKDRIIGQQLRDMTELREAFVNLQRRAATAIADQAFVLSGANPTEPALKTPVRLGFQSQYGEAVLKGVHDG